MAGGQGRSVSRLKETFQQQRTDENKKTRVTKEGKIKHIGLPVVYIKVLPEGSLQDKIHT